MLYFNTLGGDGALPESGLSVALTRDFGSTDRWRTEFTMRAKAMGGLRLDTAVLVNPRGATDHTLGS